jgi:hypothetical protein
MVHLLFVVAGYDYGDSGSDGLHAGGTTDAQARHLTMVER